MRDNVSIIFAAIFAVLLLIVFPLFSLLTRQDSIAYNKVLTLTTEFVDSVRNKGYFTEQEYTNYLAGLSSTRNTYKVEMECHKKILIKDVNKYTDENPVWVEDTEIYYNTYVENELKESKVVSLNDGDEFYIKLYNTNITTASLMYNFFLNSRIPRKIINIGYGGKILNTSGNTYAKTTFNSSYTPYITFEEVRNKNDQIFKRCYDREAGTYEMQYCVRVIYVDDENNNPIKVNFKMHNFDKIDGISISENFLTNKDEIAAKIKEKVDLRGDYISRFEVSVDDLKLVNDSIEGTISIRNIGIGQGAWKTSAYIIIGSNLGTGTTGAASTEGTTEELTLTREEASSKVKISGPYLNQDATDIVTDVLRNRENVYYKITLNDSNEIKALELMENGKSIMVDTGINSSKEYNIANYNVRLTKQNSNTQEYWLQITPKVVEDLESIFKNEQRELQITVDADVYVDLNQTSSVKSLSRVVVWNIFSSKMDCSSIVVSSASNPATVYIYFTNASAISEYITEMKNAGRYQSDKDFFDELASSQIIYTSRENSDSKYQINVRSVTYDSKYNRWSLTYSDYVDGAPKKEKVYLNFINSTGSVVSKEIRSVSNVPLWFHVNQNDSNLKIITNSSGTMGWLSTNYYWIPASESDILDNNAYYDSDVTRDMIIQSIRKYGGFYVAEDWKENKDIRDNQKSTFNEIWDANKLADSNELFSSMIYKWQLDKVSSVFGKNTPIAIKRTTSGATTYVRRFWLAENDTNGKSQNAFWDWYDTQNYKIDSYDKNKQRVDSTDLYFVGLRVLYLK